ncbi:MAG: tRNA (adenosine(37)-N6)-threonylcarbamoyltransferase complex ATPase subunit type 1 TsaE [Myxococcota bacterium]
MRIHLADPSETHALGVRLGERAFPGAVFALTGDLGAGKTALVQGIARGLGATGRVQSPTFTLVQPHDSGRLALWHADFYRLRSAEEASALGLFELGAEGVVAVEWAERFPELLPPDRLDVALTDAGAGRDAELVARGELHRGFVDG